METAQTQCWIDDTGAVACASGSEPQPATEIQDRPAHVDEVEPPDLPPCGVELGDFVDGAGERYNARLFCEDVAHPDHGRFVQVEVAEDGTEATLSIHEGEHVFDFLVPVCVIEEVIEQAPCSIVGGKICSPGSPELHGLSPDALTALLEGELEPLLEAPPPVPGPGCYVQTGERGAVVLCADRSGPLHGYVLKDGDYESVTTRAGAACEVWIDVAAPAGVVCFDTSTGRIVGGPHDGVHPDAAHSRATPSGVVAEVHLGGAMVHLPVCATKQRVQLPVCGGPQ